MIVVLKKRNRYAFSDLRSLLCLVGRYNCCVALQRSKSPRLRAENLNFRFFYGIHLHIRYGYSAAKDTLWHDPTLAPSKRVLLQRKKTAFHKKQKKEKRTASS
jgi:hypothetical protein